VFLQNVITHHQQAIMMSQMARTHANHTPVKDLAARIQTEQQPEIDQMRNLHRLFSHISMNWCGRSLTSHEVIVETIGATTTRTGLRVHAELDQDTYPIGIKILNQEMTALQANGVLVRHTFHGDWNYTLHAHPDTPDHGPT
jgi:hypothetical protein